MRTLSAWCGLALCLWLVSGASAQPLLEGAERFVPALQQGRSRTEVLSALARGYAQHGSFAKAQALIDAASEPQKNEMRLAAALGALRAGHIEQALAWAKLALPAQEITWDTERALALGSARERFLATAPDVETAAQVLRFLQEHGGVSAQALAFVNQQSRGLPPLVSEFFFQQLEGVAEEMRPVDWAGIEESLEAAEPKFVSLRDRAFRAIVEQREQLVDELHTLGLGERKLLQTQMERYGAILLARRGRFEEAEALWSQAGPASPAEELVYLQNQYLGGRTEALDQLVASATLAEDAKLDLSLYLLRLGKIEKARVLGVEPETYLRLQQARHDLARGQNVSSWLDVLEQLDQSSRPEERRMREIAVDSKMPPAVRELAFSRLKDEERAQEALSQRLESELIELSNTPSDMVSLQLLSLDEYLRDHKIALSPDNAKLLEEFCSRAPKP